MDLTKYFSDLEFNKPPDDYIIAHYGFALAGVLEKLRNIDDESSALKYLYNVRLKSVNTYNDLLEYDKFGVEQIIFDDPSSVDRNEENANKFTNFITQIDVSAISNPIVRTMISDIKADRDYITVNALTVELFDFVTWLDNVIKKIEIVNSFVNNIEDNSSTESNNPENDKIIWIKKKEDFIALFGKLLDQGFFTFRKDKYKLLCKHFKWIDGDMTPEQLKSLNNNIKNKSETHQISDELKNFKFE
jgi:hypothetical protein